MVIIGIREESKQRTRELILTMAQELLEEDGFVKVSSKDIARKCNVSQGTIFLHFQTKDNLLNSILSSNIEALEIELRSNCNPKDSMDNFLRSYLDILVVYEGFLSRAYKDYSYLSESLRRNIDNLETIIKNIFFDNLRNNAVKKLSIIDSFIAIDSFLSQIKCNLLDKEVYSKSNSIIRQRRGKIIKLHRMLFE